MNQDGDMDGLQVQLQLVEVRSRSAGGPPGLSSIPAALYFNCPPPFRCQVHLQAARISLHLIWVILVSSNKPLPSPLQFEYLPERLLGLVLVRSATLHSNH